MNKYVFIYPHEKMCHITYCLQIISYFRFYFKTSLMITPIAIKVLSQDSIGKRKLKPHQIYYLLEGFEINDDGHM